MVLDANRELTEESLLDAAWDRTNQHSTTFTANPASDVSL